MLKFIQNNLWQEKRNAALFIIAGSSNGRTADSGSVNLGSNPSPAAIKLFYRETEWDIIK